MGRPLDQLTIRGFKSIDGIDGLKLNALNVLIGANGAGKSNFVSFFKLLRAMVAGRLQSHVNTLGPTDGYFFNGVGWTKQIRAELSFAPNGYAFALGATAQGGLVVAEESVSFHGDYSKGSWKLTDGTAEAQLQQKKDTPGVNGGRGVEWYVYDSVSNWEVYHFHDTSVSAGMRRGSGVLQTARLYPNGENLAAFLMGLRDRHPDVYAVIRHSIQRIAPYFDDFVFSIDHSAVEAQVYLTWRQIGKDYIFAPGHLSDGTIRFISLVTALLQPDPPSTMLFDEPELGLHPEAMMILASLMRSASARTQLILATQSPVLLNEFDAEDVITVDQVDGASRFERLDAGRLSEWLSSYTLGEVWQKGAIIGGGIGRG